MKYRVRAMSQIILISLGANCTLEEKLPTEIEMSRVSTSDSLPLYTSDQHQESDPFWDNTPRSQAGSDSNDIPKLWESMTEMPQDARARNRHQCTDDHLLKECNNTPIQQELQLTDAQQQSNHIDVLLDYFKITETRLLSILKGYLKNNNHYLQDDSDNEILIKWFAKEGAQYSRIRILIKEICKKQQIAQPSNINHLVKTIQESFQDKSAYPALRRQSTFEAIKHRVNVTARRMSDGFRSLREAAITPPVSVSPTQEHPLSKRATVSMHWNCIRHYFQRKFSSAITKVQDFLIKANRQQ